ncbi:MAG: glycosyltransferase [Terriglobia bacterium]
MTAPSLPSVSIVIHSWNGRMLLEQMFPSLLLATKEFQDQTKGDWEVIVVDDGSVDDTIDWVESIPEKRVKLVTRRRSTGFAIACNLGFSACRFNTVVLLGNDVTVDKDFLLPIVQHFQRNQTFGVALKSLTREQSVLNSGGKLGEFRRGFWKIYQNYDVTSDDAATGPLDSLYSFFVTAGACAMDRKKLRELNGFEPLMSPFYWEDVELSYRAWKRGWEIVYEPRSIVYQDAAKDIRGTLNRVRFERLNTRNRLIFLWKNLHDPGMFAKHLGAILLLTLQGVVTLRASFFLGFWDFFLVLPAVLKKRRFEKKATRVKDRAIRKLFGELRKKSFVVLK